MNSKIIESREYTAFELLPFNRDVGTTKALEESMKEHGWIDAYPMHCVRTRRGKMKIKSGHHRFEVARRLGIPVKYVICDDTASIHQLEASTRKWSMLDYLISHVRVGTSPDYAHLKDFYERTGITLSACAAMLSGLTAGSNMNSRIFKDGGFKIDAEGLKRANKVADLVLFLKEHGIKWASNPLMVGAFSRLTLATDIDLNQLKHKLKGNIMMVVKQIGVGEYLTLLEKIYNRNSVEKVPLKFLADEAARRRSVTGKWAKEKK